MDAATERAKITQENFLVPLEINIFEKSFLSFLVRCLLGKGLFEAKAIAPKTEQSPAQRNPKYHGADNTTSVLIEIIKL